MAAYILGMEIKSNPGGIVSPENTIGRSQLCAQCWRTLSGRSIRLVAERRVGKTTVIRYLRSIAPNGTRTIFRDVGGLSSATEFVELLMRDIENVVSDRVRFKDGVVKFLKNLSGFEIGYIKIPPAVAKQWKSILENCFAEAAAASNDRIVLFWDEIPWMIQKIKKNDGESVAIDLLDTLRGIRQTYASIRMVYTGSIGLHHVISALEDDGVVSAPMNDMTLVNVPPLSAADGIQLATLLLQGEGISVESLESTAARINELTGGVPFYIHQVVSELVAPMSASPEAADSVVARALLDPNDPWEMKHLDVRLNAYYREHSEIARMILDALARSDKPLTAGKILQELSVTMETSNLIVMLRKMQQDHYVVQVNEINPEYGFLFPITKRWWRLHRGIL